MKKITYILWIIAIVLAFAIYAGCRYGEYRRKQAREAELVERRNAMMERLRIRGIYLSGEDYTMDELNAIEGNYFADRALREKMKNNGDSYYIQW